MHRDEEEIDEFDREWNKIEADETYHASDGEDETFWC